MKVKVAGVQALSYYGEEEYKNVEVAVKMIREAAAEKVDLVVLSEGFPGPNSGPMDSGGKLPCRPMETMREMARENRVHLVVGELEENPELGNTYYLTLKLISTEGEILANYARRQPDHMELNAVLSGGKEHVLPFSNQKGLSERELHGVVDTPFGTVGLSICSEIFVPELLRIQMVLGAKIFLNPMNGRPMRPNIFRLKETWHAVVRARAAENLVFVVMPDLIYERKDIGLRPEDQDALGIIASPEGVLAMRNDVGIMYAELDMERLRFLRNRYYLKEDMETPPPADGNYTPIGCRPGQSHDRLPEIYGPLVAKQPDAFDYFYFKNGLDAWKEEFERVKKSD
jgi:predicted amidohydrolase